MVSHDNSFLVNISPECPLGDLRSFWGELPWERQREKDKITMARERPCLRLLAAPCRTAPLHDGAETAKGSPQRCEVFHVRQDMAEFKSSLNKRSRLREATPQISCCKRQKRLLLKNAFESEFRKMPRRHLLPFPEGAGTCRESQNYDSSKRVINIYGHSADPKLLWKSVTVKRRIKVFRFSFQYQNQLSVVLRKMFRAHQDHYSSLVNYIVLKFLRFIVNVTSVSGSINDDLTSDLKV